MHEYQSLGLFNCMCLLYESLFFVSCVYKTVSNYKIIEVGIYLNDGLFFLRVFQSIFT